MSTRSHRRSRHAPPASERIRLHSLDCQTLEAKQTRSVRHQIPLNMVNVRTLEQARDLTL
jgi:hypothetical protein